MDSLAGLDGTRRSSACGGAHGLYSTVFFLGPHPHAAARLPERERASAARPDEMESALV